MPIPPAVAGGLGWDWGVAADGSRFLMNVRGSDSEVQVPITVVLNWTAGLKK